MQPETDAYVRQVQRHLGALPRHVRPLVVQELASQQEPERLGSPRTVARALVDGWLEARETTRSPRQLLGHACRGGAWAAGAAAALLLGFMVLNTLVLWGELARGLGDLALVELLTLPSALEFWAPTIAFCFGLGALIRLGRECGPATYGRLAPQLVGALAAASVLAALAVFGLQEAVVSPANRMLVDVVHTQMLSLPHEEGRRSPQELTLAQVWARRGLGTAEERAADVRGMQVKLGLPLLVVPLALVGAALGALATRLRPARWTTWPLGVAACGTAAFAQVWLLTLGGPWTLAGLVLVAPGLWLLGGWFRPRAVV